MTTAAGQRTSMEQARGHGGRGTVLVALMLTLALAAMDGTIVATAVPQIVDDIGGFSMFSWLFSIYLLTQTVTIPVYGKLADLYGRKPILLVGIALFLLGSALCAISWSMIALIVFRAVQGIGAGSIQATVQTIAGDLYSLAERGRVQGWLSSVWGIAAIVGPTLGGLFADYVTWRWIFLVNVPIGVVALVLLVRHLREATVRRSHTIDYLGSAGVLLACGTLVFALLEGGVDWPWLSAPSIGCFALAVIFTVATVAIERRAQEPVVPGWVWRRRVLAGSNLSYIALGLLVIGPTTFVPTYAQTVLGYGAVPAGFVLASMSITWPLASALCSHVYLRIGFRDTSLIGAAVTVVGAVAFMLLPYRPPVLAVLALVMLLGAGFGLLSTPILVGLQSTVDHTQRGVATGTVMFCRYLGQSLGAAIFGAILNGTLREHLRFAPASLADALPGSVDQITPAIVGGKLPASALDYLRHAMDAATSHVYVGLVCTAVLAVLVLLFVVPRQFPILETDDVTADNQSEPDPAG